MDLFDIICLDPMFEILCEIEYGSLILTCKKSFLVMKKKIGADNTKIYINLCQSLLENNYDVIKNDAIKSDEKILNIMRKIMIDKMDQFCFHNIMLYENICSVLQQYPNSCTRDIITLMEYYKKINSYKINNSSTNDKIEIIENYFNGTTDFDRRCMMEIPHMGDSVDYVTVRIILPDLASNEITAHYKYKNQWPQYFFKGSELEMGGSTFYYYHFLKNYNMFHGIVNNVMYLTFNLVDIFGKNITRPSTSSERNSFNKFSSDHWKHIRDLSDVIDDNYSYKTNAITGIPFIHNRLYVTWLYIRFGSIIDLIDTNDLLGDLKLEMVDATIFCRYHFSNDKSNRDNKRYRLVTRENSLTYAQIVIRNHLWNAWTPTTGKMIHLIVDNVISFKILNICLQIGNKFYPDYDFTQDKYGENNNKLLLGISLASIPSDANICVIIEYQSLIFSIDANMTYCDLSVQQINFGQ